MTVNGNPPSLGLRKFWKCWSIWMTFNMSYAAGSKAMEWAPIPARRPLTTSPFKKSKAVTEAYNKSKDAPEANAEELKHRLAYIMDYADGSILDLWIKSSRRVMAGEDQNAKLLYLVATSRLFANPMQAVVKGPSSGGKSKIRKQVLEFFPRRRHHHLHRDVGEAHCSFTKATSATRSFRWQRHASSRRRNCKTCSCGS